MMEKYVCTPMRYSDAISNLNRASDCSFLPRGVWKLFRRKVVQRHHPDINQTSPKHHQNINNIIYV